ncbi:E3 ubiquitin-protein ligase bre1, partial [Tulasnella sp. 403]
MTESRKRPMSPDNLGPSRKRRIISASDWSKPITLRIQQGEDDDEEVVADQLERFQKEAIFRRMKHYARMYHDTSQRLKDMEDRVYVKESAVAAVDACWNQLVSQVQSLLPNGLPPIDDSSLDIYNITRTLDVSEADERSISLLYQQRLREVASVTQRLLGAFVGLAPKAPHPSVEQLKMDNAALRADSTAYRSEARLLRSRLQETTSELESYRELLAIAENKIERVRSETVVILEAKVGRSLSSEEDGKKDVQMANGSPSEMNGTPNGVEPGSEEEIWKSIAEGREARIEVLSKEVGDLMQEVTRLKAELQDPTEATVAETVHYKKLFAHLSELKTNAEEANERATRLTEEVAELRTLRLDMQNAAQLSAKLDEMKSTIQKLQNDNNRIRGMRDALTNEVAMLKAKDNKMLSMAKEMKSINAFQKERIVSLVKETQRLRAALAVETGDQDYYAFIADNNEEGVSYVAALRTKLKDAERRVSALEKTIEGLHTSHPDVTRHLKSEAEARQLLAQAQERLEKYERVYGSSSGSNAAESKKLVELVAEKDETLRAIMTLKRKEDERTHGDSTAMDDLCRQVEELIAMKEKEVFDHNALEEKVSRAQAE